MKVSQRHCLTIILAALGLPLLCLGQARQSGALTGTIDSPAGRPIADARVAIYSALGVNGPTDPALHIGANAGFAATDAKGAFSVPNLAPGTYIVCAKSPRLDELDPCEWSLVPPSVRVNAGGSATVKVQLLRGVRQRLKIQDPQRMVEAARSARSGPGVAAHVLTPRGLPYHFFLESEGVNETNLQTFIAEDVDLPLRVHSAIAAVKDSNGTELHRRPQPLTVRQDAGRHNAQPVVLTL